jgi:hypothetical protein
MMRLQPSPMRTPMDPARVSALPLGSFIARNQMTGGMLAGKLF